MPFTLYGTYLSPPCRAVAITANLIDLPYELKFVDIMKKEQHQPEFVELNPLHKVPTIDDDGFILFESHAIVAYLIDKYSEDDSLYPRDLQQRAIIQQRLYFSSGELFPRLVAHVRCAFRGETASDEVIAATHECLSKIEALMGDSDWIARTPNYTVADVCMLCTLDNLDATSPGVLDANAKVTAWMERGRSTIPGYDEMTSRAKEQLLALFGAKS